MRCLVICKSNFCFVLTSKQNSFRLADDAIVRPATNHRVSPIRTFRFELQKTKNFREVRVTQTITIER